MANDAAHLIGHFNPVRIVSGRGSCQQLTDLLPEGNVLLVTTQGCIRRGFADPLLDSVESGRVVIHDQVTPNPELDGLDAVTAQYFGQSFAVIVALGGGSVLDSAKALSLTLLRNEANPLAQCFRDNRALKWASRIPVFAIPTTSGTGSEVTPFATVWDSVTHKKHSLSDDLLFPVCAILDVELTLTLGAEATLFTALDATSHALESLWNHHRTPFSEMYALKAVELLAQALPEVISNPLNVDARQSLQMASCMAGMAISQTRTAIAHSISYPLTSHYDVPHGLACSFTLAAVWRRIGNSESILSANPSVLKLLRVLESLRLHEHIARYVSLEDALALTDEMFTPSRAGNFIGNVDRQSVRAIVSESMSVTG